MSCTRLPFDGPRSTSHHTAMHEAETPAGSHTDRGGDGDRSREVAEKVYDHIENGLGQGTIAMIAFLVALPVVVVAAHCLML